MSDRTMIKGSRGSGEPDELSSTDAAGLVLAPFVIQGMIEVLKQRSRRRRWWGLWWHWILICHLLSRGLLRVGGGWTTRKDSSELMSKKMGKNPAMHCAVFNSAKAVLCKFGDSSFVLSHKNALEMRSYLLLKMRSCLLWEILRFGFVCRCLRHSFVSNSIFPTYSWLNLWNKVLLIWLLIMKFSHIMFTGSFLFRLMTLIVRKKISKWWGCTVLKARYHWNIWKCWGHKPSWTSHRSVS